MSAIKKPSKTFMDHYNESEEFRKRHKAYLMTPITCECGRTIMRVNKSKHLRTLLRSRMMEQKSYTWNKEQLIELIHKVILENKAMLENKTT
jgi:hypothetical protein